MTETINLPLLESIKRTYVYFIANFKTAINASLLWVGIVFIFDMLIRFSVLCKGEGCLLGLSNLFLVVEIIASMAVSVAFSRTIILKEKKQWKQISLGIRELKYLGYSLLILLLLIVAGMLGSMLLPVIFGVDLKSALTGMNSQALSFYFIIITIASIYSARFSLILPAVAVNDETINFIKAFQITRGNSVKIFLGIILATLPTMLLLFFASTFVNALQLNGSLALIIFSFLSVALSLMNAMLKACYLSHIYQYFMYFYNRQQAKEEEA